MQARGFPPLSTIILSSVLLVSVSFMSPAHAGNDFLAVEDGQFVDGKGRQVLLHGINLVNKNSGANYLSEEGAAEFAALADWGLNCIRLGIIWDGLEPTPGKFDEKYLKGIDQRIAWAKANGLYVILDMHQDLFSVKFSDGAPDWATLTDNKPHPAPTEVWSDAYYGSPAIQAAFDNFWNDTSAPDGIGIQEHYARAWAHVAKRYANEPAVVGYDLMNEPFIGSPALQIQVQLFTQAAKVIEEAYGEEPPPTDILMEQWTDPWERSELMSYVYDAKVFTQVIDVTQPGYAEFERTKLMAMYQRVANAIRKVDKMHILFLETNLASNMGVYSAIEPVTGKDGKRDPQQAYAPHGYDLVTDTDEVSQPSPSRVKMIFQRHGETAKRLALPMFVGEWGAYNGKYSSALPAARYVVQQFEQLLCSDTYWSYSKELEKEDHFKAIKRPYPERIAGTLLSYRFDHATGALEVVWQETAGQKAPTRVYIPDWFTVGGEGLELEPEGKGHTMAPVRKGSKSSVLSILPMGKNVVRSLSVTLTAKGTRTK